ncbi:MAG TPA: response regulator [Chthoniobacterales bacterium]|jgi:DNA-binding response OmpR family regulator
MKSPLVLLFTRDSDFARLVCDAFLGTKAVVLVAGDVRDGLQIVYQRGRELDFALMDFDNDCRGRTLLSAVHTCYEELPIVVTTSEDVEHACSLAYANGARTCLRKPLSTISFSNAIADMTGAALTSPDPTRSKCDEQNYRSEFSSPDC